MPIAQPAFDTHTSLAIPVLANLGCGPPGSRPAAGLLPGWRELRVDLDASVQPDLVADLTNLSAIPTGSVQGVWTSHCLEHLFQHQVGQALSEMHRILSAEGFACILVPDLQTIAAVIADDRIEETIYTAPAGPITPHDVVFGFGAAVARGQTFMAHRCGFTPSSLMQALRRATFGEFVVLRRPGYELAAVAHKTGWTSAAERDRLIGRLGL